MQQQGLQDLIMFRDELQQPEPTGIETLGMLRDMTARSMADQQYVNMAFGGLVNDVIDPNDAMRYAASGGIVSLPVVQAGFGGFLKRVVRAVNKLPPAKILGRTIVRPLAKTKLGNIALSAAPFLLPGNPVITAALIAAMKDPKGQGNPYKVLQAGAKAYAGQKIGEALQGAQGAQGAEFVGDGTSNYASQLGTDAASYGSNVPASSFSAPPTTASQSIFGDIGKSLTDAAYDPQGTVLSRLGERIAGTGQFEGVGLREQLGLPPAATGAEGTNITDANTYQDVANLDPTDVTNMKYSQFISGPVVEGAGPKTILGSETLGKLVPDTLGGKIAAGSTILGVAGALQGQPEVPQYDPEVYDAANIETNFDKEEMVYIDKTTGKVIPTQLALARLAEAYRSFNPRGKTRALIDSGIKTAFQDVTPLSGAIDLKASGGLIGMAYGGMPDNNMSPNGLDVRYKEFSGMVGGQGGGMQDNVYMPIVERENGQQVATLAVSPKEYVVDANTMALLGNGNPDEGAEIMDETIKDIRMAATGQKKQQNEIDGLAALNRMRRSV